MDRPERFSPLVALLAAVQFLLISPAFIRRPFTAKELGASVGFYPLVGALLGGILVGADWLLGRVFPLPLRSALDITLWVLLTGALHLDGFLDACDGLLGGFTSEKRLEIMRDERVGAYALSGGILLLLIQFSALSALDSGRLSALLLAPVLGRWGITLALIVSPYARQNGLGGRRGRLVRSGEGQVHTRAIIRRTRTHTSGRTASCLSLDRMRQPVNRSVPPTLELHISPQGSALELILNSERSGGPPVKY